MSQDDQKQVRYESRWLKNRLDMSQSQQNMGQDMSQGIQERFDENQDD